VREGPAMLAPLVVGGTVSPSRAFASPPITGLGARGLVFPLLAEPWTGGVRACPRDALSGEQYGRYALSRLRAVPSWAYRRPRTSRP
jgi:hypothetical protein